MTTESIQFVVEPATDVSSENNKGSLADLVKDTVFSSKEDKSGDTPKRRGRPPKQSGTTPKKNNGFFVRYAGFLASISSMALVSLVPELDEKIEYDGQILTAGPTEESLLPVITPLLSIADRHMKVDGLSADASDVIDACTALVKVVVVTHANLTLVREIKKMEAHETRAQSNATNASTPNPVPSFTF